MIETLMLTLKRTLAKKQGIQDISDVSHIILNPQAVVISGDKNPGPDLDQPPSDASLSTLEVRTALARIFKQVNKTVPEKLLS